jgi:hypothetical protein
MATESELAQSALEHAKKTTISCDEWCRRIDDQEDYAYTKTEWWKALRDLEAAKNLPAPQPPQPSAGLAAKAQKLMFCAQSPLTAMGAPASYIPCLTADPAYAGFVNASVISQLRSKFRTIAAWGVQTQIPAQAIRDFQARWGLNYSIFQGETDEEYVTAIQAGADVVVGNSNAWTEAHRAEAADRVNRGQLAFCFECYTNEGAPWPEASSSAGVPAASFCLGLYAAKWEPSLQAYKDHTPASVWPLVSIYHAAGVNPSEWGLLVA